MCVGLPVAASAANLTPQEKKLIRGAKKEGAVVFLNAQTQERTAKEIGAAMRKRYGLGSGFQFRNVRKGTGSVIATTKQEMKAGKITNDVVMVTGAPFFDAAAKRGLLAKLDSGHWKNHVEQVEKAGQYHNYPYVVTVFPYTFAPMWNTSCPGIRNVNITSLKDLLNPAFKGKTIVGDLPRSASSTTYTIALQDAGVDIESFWKEYAKTKPAIIFRSEQRIQAVIACERPVDMWGITSRIYQHSLKKPHLKKILKIGYYKEGQPLLGNQMVVPKGSPHPNAAKLLVEFFLSEDGTRTYVENELMFTFLKGFKIPEKVRPFIVDLSKTKSIGLKDWVKAGNRYKGVRDTWKKYFK